MGLNSATSCILSPQSPQLPLPPPPLQGSVKWSRDAAQLRPNLYARCMIVGCEMASNGAFHWLQGPVCGRVEVRDSAPTSDGYTAASLQSLFTGGSNFRGLSLPGLGARKAASGPDMLVQGGIRARGKHPERRKGRGPSVGTKDAVCMAPRIPKACQRTKMEAPTSLGPRNLQRWPTFRLFALVVPSQGVSCLLAFHCLPQLLEAAFFFFIPLFTRSLVEHPTKETLFRNL